MDARECTLYLDVALLHDNSVEVPHHVQILDDINMGIIMRRLHLCMALSCKRPTAVATPISGRLGTY